MRSPTEALSSRFSYPLFVAAVVYATALLHLRSPNIPDPDSFYHIRHAALYRTGGPLTVGFPRITCSIIGRCASDHWYGFHLLLAAFSRIDDPVLRIKVPGILLTSALLLLVHAGAVRLRLPRP